MSKLSIKQFLNSNTGFIRSLKSSKYNFSILKRSHWSKADDDDDKFKGNKENDDKSDKPPTSYGKYSSEDDKLGVYYNNNNYNKWKPEIAWVGKALENALQLYKWALPAGNGNQPAPTDRSLAEIFASIKRSKLGIQDWSLSDLTIGLYLMYLHQASTNTVEDVKGELVNSESIVQDLIYHVELAKGAYKDNATALARNSMLREKNIVKFIKDSSVLRPGYYIGIDTRKKLVILGVRGTRNVYDLITDIISSSHEEATFEGYSTHFGTAEAARWFLTHEIGSIRRCLEEHKGFRLRLVGHSLGGATASLLAIMLRKKSCKELGFSPDIVTAVGYATPPCVSKELAESCSDFVKTVVMQDDIIPRLSVSSLTRLRNEIVEIDWDKVLKTEDWRGVIDLVTNAKHVLSSVQDVAQKLADYANFKGQTKHSEMLSKKEVPLASNFGRSSSPSTTSDHVKGESLEDLYVPGTVYYIKRNSDAESRYKPSEYFTLLRRHSGEHFQRILLSSNIVSDHKCDTHYYALRDVIKGLPSSSDDDIFDE